MLNDQMAVFYDEPDSFGLCTMFFLWVVIKELEGRWKGQTVGIMPKYVPSVLSFQDEFQSRKSYGLNH